MRRGPLDAGGLQLGLGGRAAHVQDPSLFGGRICHVTLTRVIFPAQKGQAWPLGTPPKG